MNSKRIVSFDVGIKNLAYCIIDIDYDKNDFFIQDWDIINLADDRIKCCHIGRKKCNNIASTYLKLDENKYYCKSHLVKADIELKDLNLDINKSNDICSKCKLMDTYIYDNIVYCDKHLRMQIRKDKLTCNHSKCNENINKYVMINNTMYGWCNLHYLIGKDELIRKRKRKISQNCNRISLDKLCQNLIEKLDSIKLMLSVNEALIENQPTLKNPTMKTISTFLYSYFVMKRYEKKTKEDVRIAFVAPSNKIKVGGKDATERVSKTQKSHVYEITKGLGVKICKALISHNSDYEDMLNKHKKKDDMADAFLQALIMNYKLPEKYEKRIQEIDMDVVNNKKLNKIEKSIEIDDIKNIDMKDIYKYSDNKKKEFNENNLDTYYDKYSDKLNMKLLDNYLI